MHVFAWSADDALGVEGTLRCTECLTAHGQVELVAACDRQHVCEKVLWVRRRASAGPSGAVIDTVRRQSCNLAMDLGEIPSGMAVR